MTDRIREVAEKVAQYCCDGGRPGEIRTLKPIEDLISQALTKQRKETLEEAAKVAEHKHLSNGSCCGVGIATEIRRLGND